MIAKCHVIATLHRLDSTDAIPVLPRKSINQSAITLPCSICYSVIIHSYRQGLLWIVTTDLRMRVGIDGVGRMGMGEVGSGAIL